MTTPARVLTAALLVAGLVAAAWWLFPSDARKIRALLVQLSAAASVEHGEEAIARLARAARLGRLVTEAATVETETGTPILAGRDPIVGAVANTVVTTGTLKVDAMDPVIEIAPDHLTATVATTVRITELDAAGNATSSEDWRAELRLVKVEREWLLDRVRANRLQE